MLCAVCLGLFLGKTSRKNNTWSCFISKHGYMISKHTYIPTSCNHPLQELFTRIMEFITHDRKSIYAHPCHWTIKFFQVEIKQVTSIPSCGKMFQIFEPGYANLFIPKIIAFTFGWTYHAYLDPPRVHSRAVKRATLNFLILVFTFTDIFSCNKLGNCKKCCWKGMTEALLSECNFL